MVTLTADSTDAEVMTALDASIRRARGTRRALLIELRHNIESADRCIAGDWPVGRAINDLQTKKYEAALAAKRFKFSKLKERPGDRIEGDIIGDVAQHEPYVGWTTEKLISSIYTKIEELRGIVRTNPRDRSFRKGVRLINIRKLIILLVKHIHS